MKSSTARRLYLHLFVIAIISIAAYSNTLDVPFHFDDRIGIVENPLVKDFSYFTDPSKVDDFTNDLNFRNRYIGYLTFALNYKIHGLDVTGYHMVNIAIHILNAFLVYFLVILTFRTPALRTSSLPERSGYIALFTALFFVCHPIQTMAVTYVWQRVASLATMFYLLSFVMYVKARLDAEAAGVRKSLYIFSVISAVFAMKTKEMAFMLPVMIALYEFIFFEGKVWKRGLNLLPLLLTMLIIPLNIIDLDRPSEEVMGAVKGNTEMSRWVYLITSFRVMITYLRLVFLPVNQNLDYDFPQYSSFFDAGIFFSFLALAAIIGMTAYLFFRYRKSAAHINVIAFGVCWFFANLLLEQSIIPLNNVIFEHRMYLPSAGLFIGVITFVFMAAEKWKSIKTAIFSVSTIIVFLLSGATLARNNVWKDEITLWSDVVSKSPTNARGHNNLGLAFNAEDNPDKAAEHFMAAIKLDPEYAKPYYNLGNIYRSKGLIDEAIEQYRNAIELDPEYSNAYNNLGSAYHLKGEVDKAVENYLIALKLNPVFPEAYINLGKAYISQGRVRNAIIQFKIAIKYDPGFPEAHYNLGNAYKTQGLTDNAIKEYKIAIDINPEYSDAHNNLGLAYFKKGLVDAAISHLAYAVKIDPAHADAHYNLGIAYGEKGIMDRAYMEMKKGIELRKGK